MSVLNSFIVPRQSFDENTLAIISFSYPEQLSITACRSLFTVLLTKWAKETDEGMKAYVYSSEDYNIGDFATDWGVYDELTSIFKNAGVDALDIHTITDDDVNGAWNYDSVLMDCDELSEDEN